MTVAFPSYIRWLFMFLTYHMCQILEMYFENNYNYFKLSGIKIPVTRMPHCVEYLVVSVALRIDI